MENKFNRFPRRAVALTLIGGSLLSACNSDDKKTVKPKQGVVSAKQTNPKENTITYDACGKDANGKPKKVSRFYLKRASQMIEYSFKGTIINQTDPKSAGDAFEDNGDHPVEGDGSVPKGDAQLECSTTVRVSKDVYSDVKIGDYVSRP